MNKKKTIRSLAIAVCAGAVVIAAGRPRAQAQPQPGPPPVPVVVELFTSEGCSSCPPADDLLTRLVATQPVAGAQVIALGEHVDYWDRRGWHDPFSLHLFSERQSDYATRIFRDGNIYTPQMVVNGRQELVGSDYRAATAAIAKAAQSPPRVRVTLSFDTAGGATLPVRLQMDSTDATPLKNPADVWLAVAENGLTTTVATGENGGRTLQHTAVVRTLANVGRIAKGAVTWTTVSPLTLSPDWKRQALQVVAFAQDRSNRQVLGAAASRP